MVLPHKDSPDEVICFLDWVFQGIAKHSKLVLILHRFSIGQKWLLDQDLDDHHVKNSVAICVLYRIVILDGYDWFRIMILDGDDWFNWPDDLDLLPPQQANYRLFHCRDTRTTQEDILPNKQGPKKGF